VGPLSGGNNQVLSSWFDLPPASLVMIESESESYVTTDGQPWNKAPIWGLRPGFNYCLTVAGLLIWGTLSDERTGLSFTIATGPHQRSYSRVRVPWDSRPYFTVSVSRLPFSSPPRTRRVTVEVFDPASTRDYNRDFQFMTLRSCLESEPVASSLSEHFHNFINRRLCR
jgi:hypothetical protein